MSFKDFLKLAIKCLPPVLTPVIIIGGVIGGLCTATESAAIACIYAIILGVFVFKNLSLKDVNHYFMTHCVPAPLPCLLWQPQMLWDSF